MNRAVGLLIARGWMNVCAFGSFIAAGHFLAPADFGVYAAGSSTVLLFITVIGAGFSEHVISRDPERRDESGAFWCSALIGGGGALVTGIAGALVHFVFDNSAVAILLYVLAPLPLLWGLSVIHEATLIRDGRGTQMALVLFIAESVGLIVLLVALWQGMGIYALAAARVVNGVLTLGGYSLCARTKIFSPVRRQSIVDMARFSIGMIGTRLVTWLDGYGSDLILVALMAPTGLGHYRMGARLAAAPGAVLIQAPNPAQLAFIGENSQNPTRMGRAMVRAARLHLSIITPLYAIFAIVAHDLVVALLGGRWAESGDVLAIFVALAPLAVFNSLAGIALVTQGRSRRVFVFQTVASIVTTAALVVGALGGPISAAICRTIAAVFFAGASIYWVTGLSGVARGRLWKAFIEIMLAGFACMGAAILVSWLIAPPEGLIASIARLAAISVAGLVGYGFALRITAYQAYVQLWFTVKRLMKKLGWRLPLPNGIIPTGP